MNLKLFSLITVPSVALVAAGGAGVFLAMEKSLPQPAAISSVPPAPVARQEAPPAHRQETALAPRQETPAPGTAQSDIGSLSAALSATPPEDNTAPKFDVARIESTGDAVIAGRAAPGATVELLCDGKPCDRAVADQAGQFVMITPRLPAGNYELTLRSRRPDGKEATSAGGVTVALAPRPSERPVASTREPKTAEIGGAVAGAPESRARAMAPDKTAAATGEPPADGLTSAIAPPRAAVVSRGDSLWRISRMTYGDGSQYPVIFKANRNKIRNPDRIFPGQSFVLPDKLR